MFDKSIVVIDRNGKLKPVHRNALVNNTDLEIVDSYNAQTRGICNYYSMASNYGKLDYFVYLMEYSCLKTLARKHQMSVGQIIDKYRYGKTWAIPYETKNGKKYMPIVRITDLKEKCPDIQRLLTSLLVHIMALTNLISVSVRRSVSCAELRIPILRYIISIN